MTRLAAAVACTLALLALGLEACWTAGAPWWWLDTNGIITLALVALVVSTASVLGHTHRRH